MNGTPTAQQARDLAAQAEALAAAIRELKQDFQVCGHEPTRRAGFRCDTAIGQARQAATELLETADDLDRIAAAAMPGTCQMPWGVCPEHGAKLRSTGGRTWCRAAWCGRTWDYNRMDLPCAEPARWKVTDQDGDGGLLCDGHAVDARDRLVGAGIEPLSSIRGRP